VTVSPDHPDWVWAARYHAWVRRVTVRVSARTLGIRDATITEDQREATDGVLVVGGRRWGWRVRRLERETLGTKMIDVYVDVTLRSWRASGAMTERDKILAGVGPDYYLYAWARLDVVPYWLGYDVRRAVEAGVIHRALPEILNKDRRSKAAVVLTARLRAAECVIAEGGPESIFETEANGLGFSPTPTPSPPEATEPSGPLKWHMVRSPWRPPWPDGLPRLGPRRVEAFVPCADCQTGTWVRYGALALCLDCALQRRDAR
jgi:hypothetical protein